MSLSRWHALVVSISLASFSCSVAQEKPARLTYEITSAKSSPPELPDGQISPLPNGIGYNAVRVTVKDMLSVMYRIPRRQIVGGPEWVGTENFDVTGRADHTYSIDDLHLMFQNLLADRFNLKLHVAVETGPVYVLSVAKSGLRMTPVDPGTDRQNPITGVGGSRVQGDRVPMNYLCFWLGQNLQNDQRPVVDRTGLAGTYNFTLRFRPQLQLPAEGDSPETEDLPSLFQALRDQLGLELTPQKGPVSKLVIDHIEKPSAN